MLNKIQAADSMLVEAIKEFRNDDSQISYIKSILLSGAVIGITNPLLIEKGLETSIGEVANLSVSLSHNQFNSHKEKETYKRRTISFLKYVYNALKHSGVPKDSIQPSDDLEIECDLKTEARDLIMHAKTDMEKLNLSHDDLSEDLLSYFLELDFEP
ncbi:hypothetical protein JC525_19715 [Alteromonas sp. IB21]|uniref:hypothetical protein n=1 Tax=Alteromonas sp. IB21 TaxID=2779369 RepID=UPI0018E85E27|nr:hypothetical protein [Alteromonas sp. IB21]MBJ2131145.1 hypothetical protein [Alteromonas sp. IB21]